MRIIFLFGLLVSGVAAYSATLDCPAKNKSLMLTKAKDIVNCVTKLWERPENRYTFEEDAAMNGGTAEQRYVKYAATGMFHCRGFMSTASLMVKNDIVVLAGHQFYSASETPDCTPKEPTDLDKCYYAQIIGSGKEGDRYYMDPKSLRVGSKCLSKSENGLDCAAIKLKKNVDRIQIHNISYPVKPYAVLPSFQVQERKLFQSTTLVQIAAGGRIPGDQIYRTICRPHEFKQDGGVYNNDCITTPGNSGGPLIDDVDGQLTALAIIQGTPPKRPDHPSFEGPQPDDGFVPVKLNNEMNTSIPDISGPCYDNLMEHVYSEMN